MNIFRPNFIEICAGLAVLSLALIDYVASILVFLIIAVAYIWRLCFPEDNKPGDGRDG